MIKPMPNSPHIAMHQLSPEALGEVAAYFQVLAEPVRLQILNRLRQGESKVSDLAQACQCSVANTSRHLSQLHKYGLIERENRGASAYYRIADPMVEQLCGLVCGSIGQRLQRKSKEYVAFMGAASD